MSTDTSSVSQAIAARGAPITLATGETVRLRYSMLSLEQLEAEFGDLSRIIEYVETAAEALAAGERIRNGTGTDRDRELTADKSAGAIFTAITRVLLPGLLDAQATDPRTGELVWLEQRQDVAKRILDPGQLRPYMDAFKLAFSQSFDTGEPTAGGAVPPPVLPAPTASPGATGTTSPAVSPDAQMQSSGA